MSKGPFNETFGECRPWQTGILQDNTNILNNLKENLLSYEKGYKKFSVKTRSELPQIKTQHTDSKSRCEQSNKYTILQKLKLKTIEPIKKGKRSKSKQFGNKSTDLKTSKSQFRFIKTKQTHKRGLTSMESIDREGKSTISTERRNRANNSKKNLKSKVFLINFDEQNKYRRLTKKQIHQFVFGQRQKHRCQQFKEIR